eukprot:364615-Chlamydomonas_euryale.AAC.46
MPSGKAPGPRACSQARCLCPFLGEHKWAHLHPCRTSSTHLSIYQPSGPDGGCNVRSSTFMHIAFGILMSLNAYVYLGE